MILIRVMNLRRCVWSTSVWLFALASIAHAQLTGLEGDVRGLDGILLPNAVVKIARIDVNRSYQSKSDKKGHYFYTGLPTGLYTITVQSGGKDIAAVSGIMTQPGEPLMIDIDASDTPQAQAQKAVLAVRRVRGEWSYIKPVTLQTAAPAAAPQVAPAPAQPIEPDRNLTPAQKAATEKEVSDRAASARQREGVNETLNAGVEALDAKRYDEAVASLRKATEAAPKEAITWANLGAAYVGLAGTKTGPDADAAMQKGLEAYGTAVTLKPDDAVMHNNYSRALARAGKLAEMEGEAQQSAKLDPANAYHVFYNLGALLINGGQNDAAVMIFQMAIAAAPDDPGNAEAYYQYGVALVTKAQVGPGGKVVPVSGTLEAFQKYLQLAPNGLNAQGAREMLTTLGSNVDTHVSTPGATRKKK